MLPKNFLIFVIQKMKMLIKENFRHFYLYCLVSYIFQNLKITHLLANKIVQIVQFVVIIAMEIYVKVMKNYNIMVGDHC